MRTLTVKQMREADRRCIEEIGIPGAVLMNNAGMAVFEEVAGGPVGIVCGKGNNGGDGFVVARLALLAGLEPRVALLADPDGVTGDAALFKTVYERLGGQVLVAASPSEAGAAVRAMSDCAVVIDALLGTGVRGDLQGAARDAVEAWPKVPTVAVDVPSGLNADTGEVCGCCVEAETTVTFQFAKRGFENPAAQAYIGRLVVADIGIPEVCADENWGGPKGP